MACSWGLMLARLGWLTTTSDWSAAAKGALRIRREFLVRSVWSVWSVWSMWSVWSVWSQNPPVVGSGCQAVSRGQTQGGPNPGAAGTFGTGRA
eukprot:1373539-Prymnesium_polylepis.2